MTFVKSVIAWVLRLKVVRAYLLYSERRGAMLADSVTYRALFSVFAGLLLGFSVASIWLAGNPEAWKPIVAAIDSAIPGLVGEDGIVKDPTSIEPVGFTVTGIFSLVALVGAALGAIGSLRTAVRSIAGTVQDDVLFIWVILRNLALAAGIAVAFVAAAAVTFLARIGLSFITDLFGLPGDSVIAEWSIRVVSLLVVYALDVVLILGVFLLLSGLRAPAPAVWSGALLGGLGLLILQELSSLFVGGATSNPLLATFASLVALLIWMNLSTQVILIACAYITTGAEEAHDRVSSAESAQTLAQRRVRRAQQEVMIATRALRAAEEAESAERNAAETQKS
ncbi:YihY/virulence factor BrkB family protein [Microbacterium sp. YMB-B2]|uniref:YihY/virulence factor BrkB family protein n=1 Tax=Microbacterium tenebrionis TaxID=2830665 RepID=A0A9X1S0I2_9MICO|nr:YhjD/YihY/BrkB family envelope integrity protein [Microbacterium tenebrionis]MCC2029250.1 YihY/virulence factor BrkB family protein [Microbacterium tenebrionis]